ncbi:hypothetical protein GW17_00005526 [Ensete ventricosum]|nr:hypothetical protein GW17_00005526 [Ensete ventricosum]RZS15508.1 hypothetical protein BHM03_00047340 [Ensete ventricosum]
MGGTYRSNRLPVRRPPATERYCASPRGNGAPPRLPVGEQGDASSSRAGTRRHLIFPRWDEAPPRLLTRERGAALFYRETRCHSPARRRGVVLP